MHLDTETVYALQSDSVLAFAFELAMGYGLNGAPIAPQWGPDTFRKLDVIQTMHEWGLLTTSCFALALRRAFQVGQLEVVHNLVAEMERLGCPKDRTIYTTLMQGYAKVCSADCA